MESSSKVQDFTSTMYDVETAGQKLLRKSKEAPFLVAGICGALIGVVYAAKNFKNRGGLSPSLYLIHTRVAAQGAVVSAITLGVVYTMFRDHVFNKNTDKKNQHI